MHKKTPARADNLRRALAQEAARLMAEHGIRDFLAAKRKAAERFGVFDGGMLPKNIEIQEALIEYQRLFGGDEHAQQLIAQRQAALTAMDLLVEFNPRLVGAVLLGTATEHNDIQLHVFADRAETVALMLMDRAIPHEFFERRLKYGSGRLVNQPGVRFEVEEHAVDALVFDEDGIRQAPVSPVDGKPMRRASADEVRTLVELEQAPSS